MKSAAFFVALLLAVLGAGCTGLANPWQERIGGRAGPTTVVRQEGPSAAQPAVAVSANQSDDVLIVRAQQAGRGTGVTASAGLAVAGNATSTLRRIHQDARDRYAAIDSYIVRLRRREQVNGKDHPEELMYFRFRKQPWSVYFKWLGPEGTGREVIFVKGRYDNKILTRLAAGDMPFAPAGKRIALAPDNPLVRSSSRHSIEEAGLGVLIDKFGRLVDAEEKGDHRAGTVKYQGLSKRPEFPSAIEAAEQTIAPGIEPSLALGGRRLWFFDPVAKLPVLMLTYDHAGHEVEYYCYDRFQFPVRLDDADFDPDRLWTSR
jgi:hypothetical protein